MARTKSSTRQARRYKISIEATVPPPPPRATGVHPLIARVMEVQMELMKLDTELEAIHKTSPYYITLAMLAVHQASVSLGKCPAPEVYLDNFEVAP